MRKLYPRLKILSVKKVYPDAEQKTTDYRIADFLVFLYGQNEIEIYYFLLNQAEIKYLDELKF